VKAIVESLMVEPGVHHSHLFWGER
jgi:hypothetical protein